MDKFETTIENVINISSGEPDFVTNDKDKLSIKNAIIISMGWEPDNIWQKFVWGLFKHSLERQFFEQFDRAKQFYREHDG